MSRAFAYEFPFVAVSQAFRLVQDGKYTAPATRSRASVARSPTPDSEMATPRQSRRLQSAGASPAPSNAGTSRTARTSTRKNGGLPAVTPKGSHAYGSPGQVSKVPDFKTGESSLAGSIEKGRRSAVERTQQTTHETPQTTSYQPIRHTPHVSAEPDLQSEIVIREASVTQDISKSFGEEHEAGMINIKQSNAPESFSTIGCTHVIPWYYILYIYILRLLRSNAIRALLAVIMSLLVISCISLMPIREIGQRITSQVPTSGMSELNSRVQNLENSIEPLLSNLPERLLVSKDPSTGKLAIKEDFWNALGNKLASKGFNPSESAPTWDSFISRQGVNLDKYIDQKLRFHEIVPKDDFIKLVKKAVGELQDKAASIEARLEKVEKFSSSHVDNSQIRMAAAAAAREELRTLPLQQIQAIKQVHLLENANTALKTINHFSPGIGAVVEPYFTSPTQTDERPFLSFFTLGGKHKAGKPPSAALEHWNEAGDCWCAAKSGTGKAQLAVLMPHRIYPTHVTVEHVPKEGTPDPLSAPKFLELWVPVFDEEQRRAIKSYGVQCSEDMGLPTSYLCIGKMHYDLEATNHVQTFPVNVDMLGADVAISEAVVRVTENYGRDWTCIYRIRMHGEIASDE